MNCSAHNLVPARLQCAECGSFLCDMCIRTVRVGDQDIPVCSHCGGRCVTAGSAAGSQAAASGGGFYGDLGSVFTYPLKKYGLVTIIMGTLFFTIADAVGTVLSASLVGGLLSILVGIIVAGYLFKFYAVVIQQSAKGEKSPPVWGEIEFNDFGDLIRTFFRTIGVFCFSFAPAVIYVIKTGRPDFGLLALIALGLLYFPMAYLVVAYYENVQALNPVPVFRSMARAPFRYLIVVLMFYLLVGIGWVLSLGLTFLMITRNELQGRVIYTVFQRMFSLYLYTGLMHLLGIFQYHNKDRLNWQ